MINMTLSFTLPSASSVDLFLIYDGGKELTKWEYLRNRIYSIHGSRGS